MLRISTNGGYWRSMFAVFAALGVACCSNAQSTEDAWLKASASEKAAVMNDELLNSQVNAALYRSLKAHFPDMYDAFLARFVEIETATGDAGRAMSQSYEDLEKSILPLQPYILNAPTSDLWAVVEAKTNLIHVLQRDDVGLCATSGSGRAMPANAPFSSDAKIKMAEEKAAYFTAIAGGRDRPEQRPSVTPQEQKGLFAAVDRRVDMKYPGLDRSSTSPEIRCALGVAYYDALHDIPKDDAVSIMARDLVMPSTRPVSAK